MAVIVFHFKINISNDNIGDPYMPHEWVDSIDQRQPLCPSAFENHLLRLTAGDRNDRFGTPVTDDFLRRYAAQAYSLGTLTIGCWPDGVLRGLVEMRQFVAGGGGDAEAAFSVEQAWQSKGIGTALMAEALELATQYGIAQLYICCNMRNRRMQNISKRVGAGLEFDAGDCIIRVPVPRRTVRAEASSPKRAAAARRG